MKSELLFDNIDALAEAQYGPGKLRELILDLAANGRLDHKGHILGGADSAQHQESLEKETQSASLVSEIDPRFHSRFSQLPDNWFRRSLRSAAQGGGLFCDGDWIESKDQDEHGDVRLIQLADVGDGSYRNRSRRFLTSKTVVKLNCTYLQAEDVLIARMPDPLGRACIFPGDDKPCITAVDVCILRPNRDLFEPDFLMLAINSPTFRTMVAELATGTTRSRISRGNLGRLPIPVPPQHVQRRIVTRVNELLAQCDLLEDRKEKRDKIRISLNTSTLDHLTKARDASEFSTHWQRICTNFDLLYDRPGTVEHLKQAILQLAVQGRLVQQNPDDEPAKSQLRRMQTEKEALALAKKTKLSKNYGSPSPEEILFELPKGWEWCRLGELATKLGAGSTPLGGKRVYTETGVMFLRSQNVWNEGLRLADVALIPREIHDEMSGTWIEPGDLLLNITGASIGRCAIVPDDFEEGNVSQHVAIVRLVDKSLRKYIHLCLISPYFQEEIMRVQVGVSREGLSMNRLQELLIPLAPQKMQKRITERVENLLGHCDRLERELLRVQSDGGMLVAAIVNAMIS